MNLRTIDPDDTKDPMVRGEQLRLLHGSVGINERAQRLGQYYTVLWHDATGSGPVEVIFEYQQGGTASRVKRFAQRFPAGETSGKVEFSVIGDDYHQGGRVLAWRCKLLRDGRELASRHSYLWQ